MTCLLLIASFALGFAVAFVFIRRELGRISCLLESRVPNSAEKIAVRLPSKYCERLVLAVNDALDAVSQRVFEERRHGVELMEGLSDLSHDIRTPLAAAKGHLQLIEDEIDVMSPRATAHLHAALMRIDVTSEILSQMLELTRAMDPDREYELETVALLPALVSVLANHEMDFGNRSWEPIVRFENEAVRVEGEPKALERILENIIINALRHGSSTLTCEQHREGAYTLLTMSNEVAESDSIDVDALFKRFYRGDRSRAGEGTGLGLSIAKALAEGMGMSLETELRDNTIAFVLKMKSTSA